MSASFAGQNSYADPGMVRAMQTYALTKPPPGAGVALQSPVVAGATGLGAGGGAAVDGRSDASYGHVRVYVGLAPGASGTVVLNWPQAPIGALAYYCDWATIVVTGTTTQTLTWTAMTPLVTDSKPLRIDWRWSVPV